MTIEIISKILQTKTLSQTSLTISATIINGLLGVIFFIIVARILGPSSFGVFAFTIVFITLTSDIATLGTDTGLIRFIGKYIHTGRDKQFLKLGLEVKLLAWLIILCLGWLTIPFIAEKILEKSELIDPLRLGLFGVGSALLFSFITSSIQAYQKYKSWATLLVSSNGARLLIVIFFIFTLTISLTNTLITYILIPFLGFLVGLLILPKFLNIKNEWSVAREFFHYNKWVALISLTAAIGARLDTFLTAKLLPISEVGVYSVAVQLTSFIPQIFFAIATVAAPKLASFDTKEKASLYLKKLQLMVSGISLVGLILIPLIFLLIPIFYGLEYTRSITPFVILMIGQLFFLLALPSHQAIFYFFSKPQYMFFVSVIETLIIGILGLILIPQLGIIGASIAVLIGNILLFLIPTVWVILKFK